MAQMGTNVEGVATGAVARWGEGATAPVAPRGGGGNLHEKGSLWVGRYARFGSDEEGCLLPDV
jgi:hypothetical protein